MKEKSTLFKMASALGAFAATFLLFANVWLIAGEVSQPRYYGTNSLTGDGVLGTRLKTRNDGGRFSIGTAVESYSCEDDASYFQSATEDTTYGYHGGLRDNWLVDVSADVWWKTDGTKNWHYLDSDDTPKWFFNEQASDIEFRAADTNTAQVQTILAVTDLGTQAVDTITFDIPDRANVDTATFSALAASTSGDYVIVYSGSSNTARAVATDDTGSAPEPTGALWTAIAAANKSNVDISAAVTAAEVAEKITDAYNLLDASTEITASDAGSDGTVVFTNAATGLVTDALVRNFNDSDTAYSVSIAQTTAGFDIDGDYILINSSIDAGSDSYALIFETDGDGIPWPTGTPYTNVSAGNQIMCDISASSAANQTAALSETCLGNITGFSTYFTFDDSASDGTATITQKYANTSVADTYYNINDLGTSSVAVTQGTAGVASNYYETYFTITEMTALGVETVHAYWFDGENLGVAPTVTGTLHEIDYNFGDLNTDMASAIKTSTNATTGLTCTFATATTTCTHGQGGQQDDPSDGTSPVTTAVTVDGEAAAAVTVDILLY